MTAAAVAVPVAGVASAPRPLVDAAVDAVMPAHEEEWFWEGNVQAMVVGYLAGSEWRIRRVANTASSKHGVDIEADRQGERLVIEVKGYPGSTYARVERRGEAKITPAAAQARAYFSNALLSGLVMRSEIPEARVVLAFPAITTFSNLGQRVAGPLAGPGIEVWFVTRTAP